MKQPDLEVADLHAYSARAISGRASICQSTPQVSAFSGAWLGRSPRSRRIMARSAAGSTSQGNRHRGIAGLPIALLGLGYSGTVAIIFPRT